MITQIKRNLWYLRFQSDHIGKWQDKDFEEGERGQYFIYLSLSQNPSFFQTMASLHTCQWWVGQWGSQTRQWRCCTRCGRCWSGKTACLSTVTLVLELHEKDFQYEIVQIVMVTTNTVNWTWTYSSCSLKRHHQIRQSSSPRILSRSWKHWSAILVITREIFLVLIDIWGPLNSNQLKRVNSQGLWMRAPAGSSRSYPGSLGQTSPPQRLSQ